MSTSSQTPSNAPLQALALVLAALVAGGGVFGYIRTRSVPSITAGLGVGALYALSAYRISTRQPYGLEIGLLASFVLAGSSVPRALRSGKPVPSVLAVLAMVGLLGFGRGVWAGRGPQGV